MKTQFRLMAFICMLAMLATTSFTSCGDDDDDEEGSSDPAALIGTWKLVSEEEWSRDSDGESDHDIEKYEDEKSEWDLITFKEDGTWYSDGYDSKKKTYYHDSGTYTVNGNKINVIQHYAGQTSNADFSVDNGVVSFDWTKYTWTDYTKQRDVSNHDYFSDADEDGYVTFSVNGSTLTITYEETYDGDWDKWVSTFKKQ
ncbi:MAG: hypothetical protein J6T60_13500 [Bacteroidales bacterium]|nr:hypothetical protein [Bacteroidales bacterium]